MSLAPVIALAMRKRHIKKALQNGAVVVAIREPHEFDNGHAAGAINIPKLNIAANIEKLQQLNRSLLICGPFAFGCIGTVGLLRSYGFTVTNGGNWRRVSSVQQSL